MRYIFSKDAKKRKISFCLLVPILQCLTSLYRHAQLGKMTARREVVKLKLYEHVLWTCILEHVKILNMSYKNQDEVLPVTFPT